MHCDYKMDGSSRGKPGVEHKCVIIKENKHIEWEITIYVLMEEPPGKSTDAPE